MAVEITDNPRQDRYEIREDDELAGFTLYRRHPGMIIFVHTEIDPRFEGHGLAGQLIRSVLDQARADGLQVVPVCPFVRAYIERHPGYQDLVPPERRREFNLPTA